MTVAFVEPGTRERLRREGDAYVAPSGRRFPIVDGIARFVDDDNYARNFGMQWNLFAATQIDDGSHSHSADRFWTESGWTPAMLAGKTVLEVGSGAGRFTNIVLRQSEALLASVDYSNAVKANLATNGALAGDRLTLAQASIYELPFADEAFDFVFCFGVLQHTPDFRAAVRCLFDKLKPGGRLAIDFYPIKGWWTKCHAKYLLRPLAKKLPHPLLLKIIRGYAPGAVALYRLLDRLGLHVLTRFIPICDFRAFPAGLSAQQRREWIILDTFDMFSPEFDNPQRIETVARWLEQAGAVIDWADFVTVGGGRAAVVRARKPG